MWAGRLPASAVDVVHTLLLRTWKVWRSVYRAIAAPLLAHDSLRNHVCGEHAEIGPGFSTGCTNCWGNVEKRKVRKMQIVPCGDPCMEMVHPLDSPLRRARDASRSKPRTKAVGGSRKSASVVDESETDSASDTAS